MGSACSKDGLNAVDDSVHVMVKRDKQKAKTTGEPQGYVPRAEHPMMKKKETSASPVATESDDVVIPENGK